MQHVEINISVALKGEQLSRADIARVYDTVCQIFLKAENKAELFGERFSGYALSPADKEKPVYPNKISKSDL